MFSLLDLERAFHQISVTAEDIQKTVLITPFRLFSFHASTFGFKNAPSTFQKHFFKALGNLNFCFVYIDDISIASETEEEHRDHLRIVLERSDKFHLKLNFKKCIIRVPSLVFSDI